MEVHETPSVAAQPAHKLADYMSTMQAKAFPELTGLELNDMCIPGEHIQHIRLPVILIELQIETAIADTTQWTESRSLDRLVDFIIKGMFLSLYILLRIPSCFLQRSPCCTRGSRNGPSRRAPQLCYTLPEQPSG